MVYTDLGVSVQTATADAGRSVRRQDLGRAAPRDGGESVDHDRVELLALPGVGLEHCLVHRERDRVAPIRRHRVPGVCDGDDRRLDRYLFAAEAVGVAEAVPALVVVADGRDAGPRARRCVRRSRASPSGSTRSALGRPFGACARAWRLTRRRPTRSGWVCREHEPSVPPVDVETAHVVGKAECAGKSSKRSWLRDDGVTTHECRCENGVAEGGGVAGTVLERRGAEVVGQPRREARRLRARG